MRRAYTELYVHLVWSTWDRLPLIRPELEARLFASMGTACQKLGAEPLAIGGTEDHVHLLVRLPATISVADLVKQVKGSSSHLASHECAGEVPFKWQGAYGALSVSKDGVPAVCRYIQSQREHHGEGRPGLEGEHLVLTA